MKDARNEDKVMGLSPRVRGNLKRLSASGQRLWVYPRVCGGTLL